MNKRPVLILGGGSDIGLAIARRFAQEGHPIQLAARRPNELEAEASDISLRHQVDVSRHRFDVLDLASHEAFVEKLPVLPAIAVCAVGLLGDQKESERDPDKAVLVIRSNFEGPASILGLLANRFEQRGSGSIVGISSVAGDRGRASNYVYGSAKAGFTAFLSGLRNRLAHHGIHIVTVKPGIIDTRMTAHMQLPKMLKSGPDDVAMAVYAAYKSKRNVIYVGRIWRVVMLVVRAIPESLFKRTSI